MSEESSFQVDPSYVGKSSNKKRLVVIFFVVLLLLIAGLGALYLLGSSAKHSSFKPTNPIPTETMTSPTPSSSTSAQLTATPSAALSPTLVPTSLKVSILNGSGTPGAAGAVADALKNGGFTNVTNGNANSYTYTGITLITKTADSSYVPQLKKYIGTVNSSATITVKTDDTIPTDVEVIVGK
jgi:hypothetical protein